MKMQSPEKLASLSYATLELKERFVVTVRHSLAEGKQIQLGKVVEPPGVVQEERNVQLLHLLHCSNGHQATVHLQ